MLGITTLAAALTLPASAGFGSVPTLASDALTEYGAASYRFSVPDDAQIEVFVDSVHDGASVIGEGVWISDPDGNIIGFVSTFSSHGGTELHLQLPEPAGVLYDVQPVPPGESGTGIGLILFGVPAGTYRVVAGTVSNGTFVSTEISLGATAGSTLLDRMVSEGGFAHTEVDFRGVNVVAGPPVARAVVMVGATVSETVDRSLYGWFGNPFELVSQITVDGPNGSATDTTHFFDGAPAGTYDVTVDLNVGLPFGEQWLWGLDVDTV